MSADMMMVRVMLTSERDNAKQAVVFIPTLVPPPPELITGESIARYEADVHDAVKALFAAFLNNQTYIDIDVPVPFDVLALAERLPEGKNQT